MTSAISFHQWKVFGTPGGDTTGELGRDETGLEQFASGSARLLAHGVNDDQGLGLVLFQLGGARKHLVLREAQGADDMTSCVILGWANVDDNALVLVDQVRQLASTETATTFAHFIGDQHGQQNDESASDQIVVSCKCNQVINHQ